MPTPSPKKTDELAFLLVQVREVITKTVYAPDPNLIEALDRAVRRLLKNSKCAKT
jgi:hypothetical protein